MADESRYETAVANGQAYNWDQRWKEAIAAFELAVQEFPDRPEPHAGLGMAYFSLKKYDLALESYKLAARYSQGDIICLRQVADLEERLGDSRQAAQTYLAIGEIHYHQQAVEQAVDNWLRATRLGPDILRAHQRLARYYAGLRQIPSALQHFLEAARIYQAQDEPEAAMRTCRIALQFDTAHAPTLAAIAALQQGTPIEIPAEEGVISLPGTTLADTNLALQGAQLSWNSAGEGTEHSLVQDARRRATEQLAGRIFADVPEATEEEAPDYLLSKLERDALISQALDYDGRRMINDAIGCYEKAIASGVTEAAVHFNLGLLYQESARHSLAIREFSAAMLEQPFWLASHFALGESYRSRGQIDDALKHFSTVLKTLDMSTVRPEQTARLMELYDNLVQSLIENQEDGRAILFINALVGFLSQPEWREKVHEARLRLDALSGARQASESPSGERSGKEHMMILGDLFTTGSARVLEALYLSQEYERAGHLDAAIEEAYRAIAVAQDYLPAHIRLAGLLAKQGQIEAATEKYEVVGDTFRARGDMSGAIAMYEQAVALSPTEVAIRYRLIDLLRRRKEVDRALEHYVALGEAQESLGHLERSRQTYQAALALAPASSEERLWRVRLLRQLADCDMKRLEWHLAIASYRELRLDDPLDKDNAFTLAKLYFKIEQPNLAMREIDTYFMQLIDAGREEEVPDLLTELVDRHPDSIGLRERLVRLYLAQERTGDAIVALDRLAELHLDVGQMDAAAADIALIVRLDPINVASYHQLQKQLR